MTRTTLFRALPALGALVFLASCAEVETRPPVAPTPPLPYAWNGDGVPGPAKIIVDIRQQRAYFFKGKAMVGETTVSTGKPGFSTPPGSYKVVWKDKDHISTRFGDYVDDAGNVVKSNIDSAKDPRPKGAHYDGARMPYAMFFRGGYAMHQGYVPPYAASHGCIRLPPGIAEIFFNAVELGTPVIVKESSPESYSLAEPNTGPQSVPVPVTVPPPPPNLVQYNVPRPTPPASVRPASVRSTVPAPTPVPVRSPAAVLSRPPVPVRSPAPASLRPPSPTPLPVRSPAPAPIVSRVPPSVRAPAAPSVSPTPTRVRPSTVAIPTPVPTRFPAPAPVPVRSPAPEVRSPRPVTVQPSPTPVSKRHRPVHRRSHLRSAPPSPTPTPSGH